MEPQPAIRSQQRHGHHASIAAKRLAFLHQLSTRIIRDASGRYFASFVVEVEPTPLIAHGKALGLEDLNVSGMVKNKKLAGSIADAGWRQCRTLLESRAEPYGRELVVVRLPTNQVGSACGHHDGSKELSIREWQCPSCGTVHDRDINAAWNILAAGLAERRIGLGPAIAGLPGELLRDVADRRWARRRRVRIARSAAPIP